MNGPALLVEYLVELDVVGKAKAVDEIQLKVDPLPELLRRLGKRHLWRNDTVYQCLQCKASDQCIHAEKMNTEIRILFY